MSAEQPSVEALVERVRDALNDDRPLKLIQAHVALAALDSLTAALEREREASQIHEEAAVTERAYRNAAEARAQKAEAVVEAARQIVALSDNPPNHYDDLGMGDIARAALTAYDADLIPTRRDGEPPIEQWPKYEC